MALAAIKALAELAGASRLDEDELQDLRLRRLVRLLEHAYTHVPYYRRLFDGAGFRPEDLRSFNDLARVPVTTRRDLQRTLIEDLTADNVRARTVPVRSSGSTGVPVRVLWTQREGWTDRLNTLRSFWLNGWRPPQTVVQVLRRYRTSSALKRRLGRLGVAMPCLYVGDPPDAQVLRLRDLKPAVVWGFASYLGILAQSALERGVRDIRPKLLVTTGDLLTERSRQQLTEAFQVEPLQIYGCVELGTVAWQCRSVHCFHVHGDLYHLELLGEDGLAQRGEVGQVTCTSLYRFAMPLIRYQPGDLAVQQAGLCPCGRDGQAFNDLVGRTDSVIRLASGRLLTTQLIRAAVLEPGGVQAYRAVQEAPDRLVVQIVAGDGFSEETQVRVAANIIAATDGELKAEVQLVEKIPRAVGFKERAVIALPLGDDSPG